MKAKICILSISLLGSALFAPGAQAQDSAGEPGRGSKKPNPLNNVYFGEQHLHTQNSPDAYSMGTRNTVDDAYNFAKGKAIKKITSGKMVQKKTPYDWAAVTDHAEYLGVMPQLTDPDSDLSKKLKDNEIVKQIQSGDPKKMDNAFAQLAVGLTTNEPDPDFNRPDIIQSVWQKHIKTTNKHYDPGKFTTLIGFEWTSIPALQAAPVGAEDSIQPNEASSSAQGGLTSSDMAKQLHNPLSNLREVIFQLDVLPDVGPGSKTDWVGTIQPVWPFALGEGWKLVTYSIIPVVSQPGLESRDGRTNGLGDSTFFGYFVPPNEGKLIWGFGPALQAPTNTDNHLGIDKWAAGPALIVGAQPGNWSIWALFDNVWSFAGSDSEDINLFNFQYQVVYLSPTIKDWFFISNWTAEADWEAPSGDQWTVPVGGGFGKQFKIGKQQYQVYGQVGYNVVRPDDDAATWRAIIAFTKVF